MIGYDCHIVLGILRLLATAILGIHICSVPEELLHLRNITPADCNMELRTA